MNFEKPLCLTLAFLEEAATLAKSQLWVSLVSRHTTPALAFCAVCASDLAVVPKFTANSFSVTPKCMIRFKHQVATNNRLLGAAVKLPRVRLHFHFVGSSRPLSTLEVYIVSNKSYVTVGAELLTHRKYPVLMRLTLKMVVRTPSPSPVLRAYFWWWSVNLVRNPGLRVARDP